MLIKSVTILVGLVALASAATIHQRNIPVEVRYDEPAVAESVRNLGFDKVQLIPVEFKETNNALREAPEAEQPTFYGVRNLEEKIQLSPEDLTLALKHLPVQVDDDLTGAETAPLRLVEDTPQIEEITKQPDYIHSVLQQAEDIISGGLKKLRISFKPEGNQKVPDTEQWDNLEKAVNEYLSEEKTKLQLKQTEPSAPPSNQNFFQNLASGFQTIATNFIQNLPGQSASSNSTQGDEQPGGAAQGPFQGFVSYFQGGVNNIANAINNLGNQGSTTSNTVLGDTGTGGTTQPPNFISSFVNNVQQFFGQLQGSQPGASPGTQGDTGVNNTVAGPQGPGQVIQTIGSAITNFIQGRPPNTSGDEGTATTQSSNIIQSIGSVIQNSPLNPFRPPQGQKPEEVAASSQNPIQAGISGVQNIGSQIQQLIPGQGASTEGTKKPEDETPPAQNVQHITRPSQQSTSGQSSSNEISESPQAEVASNQVIEDGASRKSFTVNEEEVATVEQLNEKKPDVLNEEPVESAKVDVNQDEIKDESPQEASKENQLLEENKEQSVDQNNTQEEVKQEEYEDKEVSQPQTTEHEEPQEYTQPQVLLPVAIRQPEPFHIQLEQEEPIQVDIKPKQPVYDIKHNEPIQEESRPGIVKEQKEELLMTAE